MGLPDQGIFDLGTGQRLRCSLQRGPRGSVDRGRAGANRNDGYSRLPTSVETEEGVEVRVDEGAAQFRPQPVRLGDREEVREQRAGVPEDVAICPLFVAPGVSPERARQYD